MDFIHSQSEDQLNQLDLMLCPICNRTVLDIQAFVDPVNNKAYVSLKCDYQKNIGVVPLEKFLNEFALFESEMNKERHNFSNFINNYKRGAKYSDCVLYKCNCCLFAIRKKRFAFAGSLYKITNQFVVSIN